MILARIIYIELRHLPGLIGMQQKNISVSAHGSLQDVNVSKCTCCSKSSRQFVSFGSLAGVWCTSRPRMFSRQREDGPPWLMRFRTTWAWGTMPFKISSWSRGGYFGIWMNLEAHPLTFHIISSKKTQQTSWSLTYGVCLPPGLPGPYNGKHISARTRFLEQLLSCMQIICAVCWQRVDIMYGKDFDKSIHQLSIL